MNILFDEDALRDLESIYSWIAQDSVNVAQSVDERIRGAIRRLATYPLSGRRASGPHRELIVHRLPYVVVYEVDFERARIVVSQIVHMARNRAP